VSRSILDGTANMSAETDEGEMLLEVPVSSEGYVFELLQLPPRVRKLVWQPSLRGGSFEQTPLLMRKVGMAERRWMMARRVVGYSLSQPAEAKTRVGLSLWRSCLDLVGQYRACGKLRSHVQPLDKGIEPHETLSPDDYRPE
jgi:hypothetical protein